MNRNNKLAREYIANRGGRDDDLAAKQKQQEWERIADARNNSRFGGVSDEDVNKFVNHNLDQDKKPFQFVKEKQDLRQQFNS